MRTLRHLKYHRVGDGPLIPYFYMHDDAPERISVDTPGRTPSDSEPRPTGETSGAPEIDLMGTPAGPTWHLRGRGGSLYVGAFVVVAAVIAYAAWHNGGLAELAITAPLLSAIVVIGWLFFHHPEVRLDDEGVHVINLVRVHHIPWRDLESVSGGLTLRLCYPELRETISWSIASQMGLLRSSSVRRAPKQPVPVTWEGATSGGTVRVDPTRAREIIELRQQEVSAELAAARRNPTRYPITTRAVALAKNDRRGPRRTFDRAALLALGWVCVATIFSVIIFS